MIFKKSVGTATVPGLNGRQWNLDLAKSDSQDAACVTRRKILIIYKVNEMKNTLMYCVVIRKLASTHLGASLRK